MKTFDEPDDPDQQDHRRQNPRNIKFQHFRKIESGSGIRLRKKIPVSPSPTARTEQRNQKSSERQEIIADNEILKVQDRTSPAERLKRFPEIESENAGKRKNEQKHTRDQCRFPTGKTELVNPECDHILRNGNQRCNRRDAQKQEEDGSTNHAEFHIEKNTGQSDKDQRRPLIRRNAVGETTWENDESRADRNKGIKPDNDRRLLRKRLLSGNITAADRNTADTCLLYTSDAADE